MHSSHPSPAASEATSSVGFPPFDSGRDMNADVQSMLRPAD